MHEPSTKLLHDYARVLIEFALNSGKGIKKGDAVYLVAEKPSLPLAREVYKVILARGGHPMLEIVDDDITRIRYQLGTDNQIAFFPSKYYRGLADSIQHWVRLLAEEDPMFLKGVDPRKIMLNNKARRPFRKWLDAKEDRGRFTWTLCLYGTPGMANEAGLSLPEYWRQIRRACFLDARDPIATWRRVFRDMNAILRKINALPVESVRVRATDTDLTIRIGERRRWLGGSGRNIPSFEIFTSPDWRGTEGRIRFDLPLYRYGNIIRDIRLEFRNGRVVKAAAGRNEKLLLEMIKQKNADKVGEFSLTDRRFSRITRFMANTLFDENFGGAYGNTHIAVGRAYHDTCTLDPKRMSDAAYARLGFNDSVEHTDIIASTRRTVTATLRDGSTRLLYEDGEFAI
jgi:aminopeptidase